MYFARSMSSRALAVCVTVWAAAGVGEQVVVQTNATAAGGTVSQSDVVLVDFEDRAFSPPLVRMAERGESVLQTLVTDTAMFWGLRYPDSEGRDEIVELPLTATARREAVRIAFERPIVKFAVTPSTADRGQLAVVMGSDAGATLLVFTRTADGSYLDANPETVDLPGAAVDLAWIPEPGLWAALCEPSGGPVLEVFRDGASDRVAVNLANPALTARRVVGIGDRIVVVASGYDVDRADGASISGVQVVHPTGRRELPCVFLQGELVSSPDAVMPVDAKRVWVATESRSTPGAVASLIRLNKGPAVESALNLPPASVAFRAVVAPGGGSALFACGRSLQHYAADGSLLGAHEFEAVVRALIWDRALIVGEENRLHRIAVEDLAPERTVHLFSGLVAEAGPISTPLPALGDADGDNVLDTVDPRPQDRAPALTVPRTVRLRSNALGRPARAIPAGLTIALRGYEFRLDVPGESGLVCEPTSGQLPAVLEVGMEAAYWSTGVQRTRAIPIVAELFEAGVPEPMSSATIRIVVERPPEVHGRVLVVQGGTPDAMNHLADLLRAPPQYYSVSTKATPALESLNDYQIVVIPLDAALAGRVPRVALERYVARGGALLITGSSTVASALNEAREWLAPFGIDVRSAAAALRAVPDDCDWCAVWSAAGLREGLLASVEPPGRVMFMPGRAAREGPLARAPLGRGRVVFAGSDGLFDAARTSPPIREALLDAVRWLARTRAEVLDRDGDGLADDVEDVNRNGIVDEGETDPSRADSDGDLVIDGLEDANGNGRVDEGETDPRNPDTDGDRIADGADARPALPGPPPGGESG